MNVSTIYFNADFEKIVKEIMSASQEEFSGNEAIKKVIGLTVSTDINDAACFYEDSGLLTMEGFINGILYGLTGKALIYNDNISSWEIKEVVK